MTDQEYSDIGAACDRVLRAPGRGLARLAIPELHFLNEHPSAMVHYAPLLGGRPDRWFSILPKALLRAGRGLARSLFAPRATLLQRGPIDVLIVSHLLKPQQLRENDDFYFGALQSRLYDAGLSSMLLLINHLTANPMERLTEPIFHPRLVLPGTVSLSAEAKIWLQCANASRALRHEAASAVDLEDSKLAALASRKVLSASTVVNLRMHAVLAGVCKAVDPKMVITTYEGTVAERLIWQAARSAKRRPLCVGYQHASVLERAHAIRRPVAAQGLDCDPDVVLTLGEITHAALAASPELKAVRFIQYGSHRRATLPVLPELQHRPPRCIVLPDASDQECVTLFDFALACARYRPDISFALRPHPVVDTHALLRRHPEFQRLPPNVTLAADGPLEREFAQARYCLYRSSSAALHAVRAGIKPYYLAQPGELPIDCLYAIPDWRETVTSPADLANRMGLGDPFTESTAANRAMDVCDRYVAPIRPAAINELVAMVPR
jgi:hypothetical protein